VGLPPALSRHQNYCYWGPRGLYRRMHTGCELTFGCGAVDLESGHLSRCAYLSMAVWLLGRVTYRGRHQRSLRTEDCEDP
jgi:hypothetical protein